MCIAYECIVNEFIGSECISATDEGASNGHQRTPVGLMKICDHCSFTCTSANMCVCVYR